MPTTNRASPALPTSRAAGGTRRRPRRRLSDPPAEYVTRTILRAPSAQPRARQPAGAAGSSSLVSGALSRDFRRGGAGRTSDGVTPWTWAREHNRRLTESLKKNAARIRAGTGGAISEPRPNGDRFRAPWMAKQADKIRRCGEDFALYRCADCGGYVETLRPLGSCNHRLCAFCARRRQKAFAAKVAAYVDAGRAQHPRLTFLTVTVRNVPLGRLKWAWRELAKAFQNLRDRRCFAPVAGGFYSREATYNAQAETWHPHLHAICPASWIDLDAVRRAWEQITARRFGVAAWNVWACEVKDAAAAAREVAKGASVVGLRSACERVAGYVAKGAAKFAAIVRRPDVLGELVEAIDGLRLTQGFGCWYGRDVLIEEELSCQSRSIVEQHAASIGPCPHCGSVDDVAEDGRSRLWSYVPRREPMKWGDRFVDRQIRRERARRRREKQVAWEKIRAFDELSHN